MGLKLSVTKNALANLVRGGATAAVAVVLPRFLTRSLDAEHFSAWSLILQLAAYASYMDFGLQMAVARFIAQSVELEQKDRQAKLVSTALLLLSLAALLAFSLIAILVWLSPNLFRGVSRGLLPDFRVSCLVLSLTACLLLPLSTYTGVLIGMRRNEVPALAIGGTRIAGAALAIVAANRTQSLTVLALCVGIPNLLGGLIQMTAVQQLMAEGRVRYRFFNAAIGHELLRFCAGLAIWSFGMLLVSGLDVTIVGHYQFAAVGFYSLAAMLITFFSGLTSAAVSALMAPVSALHARGDVTRIREIVFMSTRMVILVNLAMSTTAFLWGDKLLRVWVGPVYAASALPILKILVLAQTLRLAFAPYSVMLISLGEQNKNVPSAICEAAVNLTASIVGMRFLGPIGVAWGTLAGALCAVVWVLLRSMPSVGEVRLRYQDFMQRAILPSSIPFLPFGILLVVRDYLNQPRYEAGLGLSICAAAILCGSLMLRSFRPFAQH